MMLLFCSVLLHITIVHGGYVDIVLQNDNFTGLINFTSYAYTGFFSMLVDTEQPVCQFGYIFGESTANVTSTTCSFLNITDFGKSFACGEVNSTIFECIRMGEYSSCENNKSWIVFYHLDDPFNKQCAGMCLTKFNENISVLYQQNITAVPDITCPRPADTKTTALSTAAPAISEIPTSTSFAPVTSNIPAQTTDTISDNSTIYGNYKRNNNIKVSIPLIAGLCTGGGVLIIVIVVVIVVSVKRRTTKSDNNIHRTNGTDPSTGNSNVVYDISNEKMRDTSIHNGRELSKISGIDFDVMGDIKAEGNDTTKTNHKNGSINKAINLKTDQVDQVGSVLNNKHNQTDSFISSDNDSCYLEVRVPKLDNKTNDKASTTNHSNLNVIDSGYELVDATDKPISNIYARLGDNVREFENPYNLDNDNNLKETDSGSVNVNAEKKNRHDMPENVEISPGPVDVIVVEKPNDVYAQVMETK